MDDTVTDGTKLNYTDDHKQIKMSFNQNIQTKLDYFMLKVVKEVSASKRKAKNHATKDKTGSDDDCTL